VLSELLSTEQNLFKVFPTKYSKFFSEYSLATLLSVEISNSMQSGTIEAVEKVYAGQNIKLLEVKLNKELSISC